MNLLLAVVLLMQDKSAQETFEKIEETILKAKTVSVKFRHTVEEKRSETSFRREGPGAALLKEGGKAQLTFKWPESGEDKEFNLVSDGINLAYVYYLDDKKERTVTTPKGLEKNLRIALIRTGLGGPALDTPIPWYFVAALNADFAKDCQVSDVKFGPPDRGAKTLIYKVEYERLKDSSALEVKLWYDPESWKPLKRSYAFKIAAMEKAEAEVLKFPMSKGIFTESYEEFTLNADIPDEKFKLPVEKK